MTAYTDQDVELVAGALAAIDWGQEAVPTAAISHGYQRKARAVLDALTAAHRLIPADAIAVATTVDNRLYQPTDIAYVIPAD
jgi:hypothetical protein